jgi:hypothetical protein
LSLDLVVLVMVGSRQSNDNEKQVSTFMCAPPEFSAECHEPGNLLKKKNVQGGSGKSGLHKFSSRKKCVNATQKKLHFQIRTIFRWNGS